ncbi:unnamed protein product [Arctia plantaginis]|uniref:Uncharacterized protein n=1 Tax=Arctia plantaginis TaxID=874455 RepID=A0A8S1BJT4_ARCPL|nr:unnamed protein product [Arctia plantaginis]
MNPPRQFFFEETEPGGQVRMEERTMARCGFCSILSGLLRRAMCVGSRRGSSDSYYRELGDQDTLKIEDRSELSDNVDADEDEEIRKY